MKKAIMPYVAKAISGDFLLCLKRTYAESKRRLSGAPHTLEVYIHIADPYSYLLLQVLPVLLSRYNLEIQIYPLLELDPKMFPAREKYQEYAIGDANHLAKLYGLKGVDLPALGFSQATIEQATGKLLVCAQSVEALTETQCVFASFWLHQSAEWSENTLSDAALKQLANNQLRLRKRGHYLPGVTYYAGEFYWGIDRLDHLERRLNRLLSGESHKIPLFFDRQYRELFQPTKQAQAPTKREPRAQCKPPLVMYFSARSPYSYIGLELAIKFSEVHQLELIIKPVLPMMMRGMNVPDAKKMAIFHDAKREAKKHGLDYGYVADPLGRAVENCYAIWSYAVKLSKGNEFLRQFARAVNAQGVHGDSIAGLRKIVRASDIDWPQAQHSLNDSAWRTLVKQNMDELDALGLWGVPCFQYGDLIVWGQDRLWKIKTEIESQ